MQIPKFNFWARIDAGAKITATEIASEIEAWVWDATERRDEPEFDLGIKWQDEQDKFDEDADKKWRAWVIKLIVMSINIGMYVAVTQRYHLNKEVVTALDRLKRKYGNA